MVRKNDFKYIFIRVLIGVLIAIICWFLKNNVFALGNVTIPPTSQTFYYVGGGGQASPNITQFSRTDFPNITFYGVNQNTSGTKYNEIRFNFNDLSSLQENGLYNIDFLFSNAWNGYLLNQFTFAIYSNGGFYTCTSNDSNTAVDNELISAPKYVIGIQCDNVYINKDSNIFYVVVVANESTSYGDRVGITRLNFTMNAFSSGAAEISNAVNETNDTIKDDSVDNEKASSDIETMQGKVASNGTITQLLTLPISMYQAILNDLNSSGCHSYGLGMLYGHFLSLPCVSTRLQEFLGNSLYTTIDIILAGMLILALRKKFVDIFNHMTSLKDRGNEVE